MTPTLGYALLGGLLIVRGLHVMAYGLWEWDLARCQKRNHGAVWRAFRGVNEYFEREHIESLPATTHGDVRLVRL